MHRAASSEPITSERTYIIWHAGPQGFGNRLRGLLGFVLLSLALNKVLYIAWEEPVHFRELLKPKADFDAAQHLDRLTSHVGKADTFCIPCGTDLVDHGCKPGLEPVTILTEALWRGNYVQVVPSKHMRRDAYTHARTQAQTSAHARRHACARTHARTHAPGGTYWVRANLALATVSERPRYAMHCIRRLKQLWQSACSLGANVQRPLRPNFLLTPTCEA
jgi:hypothetical protein